MRTTLIWNNGVGGAFLFVMTTVVALMAPPAKGEVSLFFISDKAIDELVRSSPDGTNQVVIPTSCEPDQISYGSDALYYSTRCGNQTMFYRIDNMNPMGALFDSISVDPWAFDVDGSTSYIYVGRNIPIIDPRPISRIDVKKPGEGLSLLLQFPADGLVDVRVDQTAGLFWGRAGNGIFHAGLNGANPELLVAVSSIKSIALDIAAGKLYGLAGALILRSNLDGTAVDTVATLPSNSQSTPISIAVDGSASEIYWTSHTDKVIHVIDFDGNNVRQFDVGALVRKIAVWNDATVPVEETTWGRIKSLYGE